MPQGPFNSSRSPRVPILLPRTARTMGLTILPITLRLLPLKLKTLALRLQVLLLLLQIVLLRILGTLGTPEILGQMVLAVHLRQQTLPTRDRQQLLRPARMVILPRQATLSLNLLEIMALRLRTQTRVKTPLNLSPDLEMLNSSSSGALMTQVMLPGPILLRETPALREKIRRIRSSRWPIRVWMVNLCPCLLLVFPSLVSLVWSGREIAAVAPTMSMLVDRLKPGGSKNVQV